MSVTTDIELDLNPSCCICLSNEPIKDCCYKDTIRHLPCSCNMYVHESCFFKTDITKCIICKNRYEYTWGNHPTHKKKLNCFKKILNYPYLNSIKKQYKACEYYCKIKRCCCWNIFIDFLFMISLFFKFTLMFFVCVYIFGYFMNFIWALLFCDISKTGCFIEPNNGLIILIGIGSIVLCMPCFGLCFCLYETHFKHHFPARRRVMPIQN